MTPLSGVLHPLASNCFQPCPGKLFLRRPPAAPPLDSVDIEADDRFVIDCAAILPPARDEPPFCNVTDRRCGPPIPDKLAVLDDRRGFSAKQSNSVTSVTSSGQEDWAGVAMIARMEVVTSRHVTGCDGLTPGTIKQVTYQAKRLRALVKFSKT